MKDITIKVERINDKWYVSNDAFLEMAIIYEEEIRSLKSIIKEVREYIKENSIYYPTSDGCQWVNQFKVLEILEKVEENSK